MLPTGGTARFFGPLSCNDFVVASSLLEYDEESAALDADDVRRLCHAQRFDRARTRGPNPQTRIAADSRGLTYPPSSAPRQPSWPRHRPMFNWPGIFADRLCDGPHKLIKLLPIEELEEYGSRADGQVAESTILWGQREMAFSIERMRRIGAKPVGRRLRRDS